MLLGQIGASATICLLLSLAGLWCARWVLPNLPLDATYVYYLWLMLVWGCFLSAMIDLTMGTSQLMERARTSVFLGLLNYGSQVGLGVAAVVLLGWQGFGRQGTIFLGFLIAASASAAILWRYGRGAFDSQMFRNVAGKGLTFIPHALATNLQWFLNAWLLDWWISPATLAVYGIAIAFAALIDMPVISLTNAAYPTLARWMNDGSTESRRQQARLYTLLAIGIVVLSLGSLLFSPVAIHILTAPAYHEAAQVVGILILAWLFQGFYNLVLQPAFYFGGGLVISIASVSAVVATAVFSLLLIPRMGMYGAAWAVVACFGIKFAVAAVISWQLYALPWEVSKIAAALACGLAIATADHWLSAGLGLVAAIGVKSALLAAMVPALWITRAVSAAELRRLMGIVLERGKS
jgi:O-antigen/teichoic acid export membrane protein